MRLIDADEFIANLKDYTDKPMTAGLCVTLVELALTAYDIDKVVAELEEKQQKWKTKLSESDTNYMDNAILKQYISHYDIAIEIVRKGGVADDVCEWHKVKNDNAYKSNTHAEIYDSRVLDWCKCPYCGKKIKAVE